MKRTRIRMVIHKDTKRFIEQGIRRRGMTESAVITKMVASVMKRKGVVNRL